MIKSTPLKEDIVLYNQISYLRYEKMPNMWKGIYWRS